jgi:hypothetical protein
LTLTSRCFPLTGLIELPAVGKIMSRIRSVAGRIGADRHNSNESL